MEFLYFATTSTLWVAFFLYYCYLFLGCFFLVFFLSIYRHDWLVADIVKLTFYLCHICPTDVKMKFTVILSWKKCMERWNIRIMEQLEWVWCDLYLLCKVIRDQMCVRAFMCVCVCVCILCFLLCTILHQNIF